MKMLSHIFELNLLRIILYFYVIEVLKAFTVEELKGINYEVDISVTPVKKEETSFPAVYITSRNGQEFQCLLPQLHDEETSEKEVINEKETDVLELLKPMKTGSCLSKAKDWWTYEFCFGHYIKQFHVEDGEIIGQVITLGLYDSDYDWNNETDQEKFKHTKQKYHSQYYTNGTKCDLTGQPRNAEVRIYCEEDAGDYIYRVDEPATCSYIITIHTSRLCSHPLLKPLPSSKAHPITCHPLLNEEQYISYLDKLKEEKAHAEEKRNQWLINQQERLQVIKNENVIPIDEEKARTEETRKQRLLNKQERLQKMKDLDMLDIDEEEEDGASPGENKPLKSVKENYETVRAFLIKEYNKEMEKVKAVLPAEKFASVKDDIQKQFDAILDEVKEDFDSDLSGEAEVFNLDVLKFGLNLLSEKLDKAVKDVVEAQEKLNKARSAISEAHTSDGEDSPEAGLIKDANEKENVPIKDNSKDISSDQSRTAVLDDDKLQVRIRRFDQKSSDANGKLHEMDFEQRKKLEQVVKEKLEKAGLDTGGRRIEVKIITAGYYDNEDGKDFEFLTDEETDQFQNMIMALLTGQQEAVQEMKRHKKLEENYKFTWNYNEETDNKED